MKACNNREEKKFHNWSCFICAIYQFISVAVIAELPDFFIYRPNTLYVNYPHGKREDFIELAMFVE